MIALLLCCFSLIACDKSCKHSDDEWTVATEATCTTAGMKILQCEKCGEQSKTIPAKGHQWVDADCTNAKKCSVCEKEEGVALGHEYISQTKKAAKCTETGTMLNTCSRCHDTYETEIKMLGHTNSLKSTGVDVCSTCKKETYTTYSVKALSRIYAALKAPASAKINSVYAGETTWDSKSSIVVVISLSAQNSWGGTTSAEYVVMIDVATGVVLSYDLVGDMQEKADYYDRLADSLYGQSAIDALNKSSSYLSKVIAASNYKATKTTKLKQQDLAYIDPLAKAASGAFN